MSDLHLRAHFGFSDNVAEPQLIGTSVIDIFVKEIFPKKYCIVPTWSRRIAIISEYTCQTERWLYYKTTGTLNPLLSIDKSISEGHRSSEAQSAL